MGADYVRNTLLLPNVNLKPAVEATASLESSSGPLFATADEHSHRLVLQELIEEFQHVVELLLRVLTAVNVVSLSRIRLVTEDLVVAVQGPSKVEARHLGTSLAGTPWNFGLSLMRLSSVPN